MVCKVVAKKVLDVAPFLSAYAGAFYQAASCKNVAFFVPQKFLKNFWGAARPFCLARERARSIARCPRAAAKEASKAFCRPSVSILFET